MLDSRTLILSTAAGDRGTVIRVDAVVTWLPPRPSNSLVPKTVRAITVTFTPGSNMPGLPKMHSVPSVTVTDPVTVAQVIAAVNTQPTQQPGVHSCPMGRGTGMTLLFSGTVDGPAIAKSVIGADGCEITTISVIGGGSAKLGDGYGLMTKIAKIVHMKLPK